MFLDKAIFYSGQFFNCLWFYLYGILFFSFIRVILLLWKLKEVKEVNGIFKVFIYGIRIDIIFLSIAVLLPVLLSPVSLISERSYNYFMYFTRIYFLVFTIFMLFMEFSTFSFIEEYGVRPNRLFIEYLVHPVEVFSTVWSQFKFQLIGAVVFIFIFIRGMWIFSDLSRYSVIRYSARDLLLIVPVLVILLFLGARSSFKHRAANISTVAFSTNPTVNDLCLNSSYSVLYALYRMKDEENASKIYGNLKEEKLIENIKKSMNIDYRLFTSTDYPTMHKHVIKNKPQKKKNLVIILEESMGATFVKSLGGHDYTPELEKLKKKGVWFNNLYATGTRTVRGIEAVLSGFLPTPGRSVVKLGMSQNNFFTLASYLKKHDYKSKFIYGGESHFDNMMSFFTGNGFDFVCDQNDFEKPKFLGTWGVSDEDLFDRANEEFKKSGNDNFFGFILTTSNHLPFEFPDNTIKYEGKKNTLENAVRYADYSLGKFFEMAEKEEYYKNTVFLVVADHELRVSGNEIVPVEKFKIPGLIINSDIDPCEIDNIASQIDLPVTLLSLIGTEGEHPMTGRDMTKEWEDGGRAVMQYGYNQAYYTEKRKIIFQTEKKPELFINKDGDWISEEYKDDDEFVNTALSTAIFPSYVYYNKKYPAVK